MAISETKRNNIGGMIACLLLGVVVGGGTGLLLGHQRGVSDQVANDRSKTEEALTTAYLRGVCANVAPYNCDGTLAIYRPPLQKPEKHELSEDTDLGAVPFRIPSRCAGYDDGRPPGEEFCMFFPGYTAEELSKPATDRPMWRLSK